MKWIKNKGELMKKIGAIDIKLPIVIGLVILFVYYMQARKWSESGRLGNIEIYILSAALFFIVVGIAAFLLEIAGCRKIFRISDTAEKYFVMLMILVGGGGFL